MLIRGGNGLISRYDSVPHVSIVKNSKLVTSNSMVPLFVNNELFSPPVPGMAYGESCKATCDNGVEHGETAVCESFLQNPGWKNGKTPTCEPITCYPPDLGPILGLNWDSAGTADAPDFARSQSYCENGKVPAGESCLASCALKYPAFVFVTEKCTAAFHKKKLEWGRRTDLSQNTVLMIR